MHSVEFQTTFKGQRAVDIPPELSKQFKEGDTLHVRIQVILGPEERRRLLLECAGTMKDDPSVGLIFQQIDRERRRSYGRRGDNEFVVDDR